MPEAEVDVDETLVRRLLEAQHPDLADRALVPLPSGWDNFIFRLGDELTVRLPRRQMSADLVDHEQRWLPLLAPRLPIPIPVPVRVGKPGLGYPWSWSVVPWLAGEIAARVPPADPFVTAEQLGAFLHALHEPAPEDAPVNPYRGGPLTDRAPAVLDRIRLLGDRIDWPRDPRVLGDAEHRVVVGRTRLAARRPAPRERARGRRSDRRHHRLRRHQRW